MTLSDQRRAVSQETAVREVHPFARQTHLCPRTSVGPGALLGELTWLDFAILMAGIRTGMVGSG